MRVLVINGSPRGKRSVTMKLTEQFLAGMEEEAIILSAPDLSVAPCKACYACWFQTSGVCVQKDDMGLVLEEMRKADCIIWSTPIYSYSAPAQLKPILDRMLSTLGPKMVVDENNQVQHVSNNMIKKPMVLISSCGMPDISGTFDGFEFQMKRSLGKDMETIFCAEGPLFSDPKCEELTKPYLSAVYEAGKEYKRDRKISEKTRCKLQTPPLHREAYIGN